MKQSNIKVDNSGVYIFKRGREVLYIGKATSLKDRARSYFRTDLASARGSWIAKMVAEATRLDYIVTDSVLEALILEASLIKKHQPKYNAREKDDKSYLYVVITKEDFPRVLMVRGKQLQERANFRGFTRLLAGSDADQNFPLPLQEVFGPFPHGAELKVALKIIRKIFPFRDKCVPCDKRRLNLKGAQGLASACSPCFNAQIGLCPGVCAGQMSKPEYARTIRHLKLFFAGRKKQLVRQLEREMDKKQVFALQHIQDVALIKRNADVRLRRVRGSLTSAEFRIEAYDVAHLSGKNTVGAMTVVESGEAKPSDYRKFKLRGASAQKSDDIANLREIIERRLNHLEWSLPNLIVVDGGLAQRKVAEKILLANNLKIPVVSVVKDEHHRAKNMLGDQAIANKHSRDIVLANSEAHRFAGAYHRHLRRRMV